MGASIARQKSKGASALRGLRALNQLALKSQNSKGFNIGLFGCNEMVGLLPQTCHSLIIDCLDFDISNQQLRMAIDVETNK